MLNKQIKTHLPPSLINLSACRDSHFSTSHCRHYFMKNGFFFRSSDRVKVQKYICKFCKMVRSDATEDLCKYQKKRQHNARLFTILVSGVSLRRSSEILCLNYKTIVKKFIFLGQLSQLQLQLQNKHQPPVKVMEFDDLETFEHTKCKPLSVVLGVDKKTRRILGFSVSQMPAKGLLSKISVKKYGKRKDLRPQGWSTFFNSIQGLVDENAEFKSDKNPHYSSHVLKHFKNVKHTVFESRKGAVTGQGELKKVKFDPLFSINHTFAKLRADINRLFRRTWCTTKKPERLSLHIAMMSIYHNYKILKDLPKSDSLSMASLNG